MVFTVRSLMISSGLLFSFLLSTQIFFVGDIRPHRIEIRTGPSRTFSFFMDEVRANDPDLVVFLGDLISNARDSLVYEKRFDKFAGIFAAGDTPGWYVAGNHDVATRAGRSAFERRFGKSLWAREIPETDFLMIGLDSNPMMPRSLGWGSSEAAVFVDSVLDANDSTRVILVTHHPLWTDSRWEAELLPKFKGRLVYFFAGHIHGFTSMEKDGVRYIATGGGGSEIADEKLSWSGGFHHYVSMTISPSGERISIRPLWATNPFDSVYSFEVLDSVVGEKLARKRAQRIVLGKRYLWDLVFFVLPLLGVILAGVGPERHQVFRGLALGLITGIALNFLNHHIPLRFLMPMSFGVMLVGVILLSFFGSESRPRWVATGFIYAAACAVGFLLVYFI